MKIEIEIEDKYLNAVAAQMVLVADSEYEEMIAEQAKKKCMEDTIILSPDSLGDDAKQLQLGLAMMAMGQVADEIEYNKRMRFIC